MNLQENKVFNLYHIRHTNHLLPIEWLMTGACVFNLAGQGPIRLSDQGSINNWPTNSAGRKQIENKF